MSIKTLPLIISLSIFAAACGRQPNEPRAVLNPASIDKRDQSPVDQGPVGQGPGEDKSAGDTIVVKPIEESDLLPVEGAAPVAPEPAKEDRLDKLPLELRGFVQQAMEHRSGKDMMALDEVWNLDSFKALHNSASGQMSIGGTLTVHKKALGIGIPGESMHFIVLIDNGSVKEFKFNLVNKGDIFRKLAGPIGTVIAAYFGAPIPVDGILDLIDDLLQTQTDEWHDKAKKLAAIISLELYQTEQEKTASPL